MKKIILLLVAILTGLYIVLAILGSRGEYAAEKMYYDAARMAEKIAANPDVVPPRLIDYIEKKLKTLLQRFPTTEVAKTVDIKLAEFYISLKKYDLAIAQLDTVIKKHAKNKTMLSMAYFLKGLAYERQDKWADALKQYEIVRDSYAETQVGLQVPVYIGNYYMAKGREADARQAYGEAIKFYKELEEENSGKPLGYMASLYVIQAYMRADNFEAAATEIEKDLDKYYSPMTLVQLLPLVEHIIVVKLNDPEKAIAIYRSILAKSKDQKLNDALEKRIKDLSAKKAG
jgi:tetratricopeptide (TPR) repeat protein